MEKNNNKNSVGLCG